MERQRVRSSAATVAAGCLTLLIGIAGCVSMNPPLGFVELSGRCSEFKAVAADNALVWVRRFEEDAEGDAAFWGV